MNYRECLKIRSDLFKMIGTIVTKKGIDYRIEVIIICPSVMLSLWVDHFEKTGNSQAVNKLYIHRNDLEVYLYCLNLESHNLAILNHSELIGSA